MSINPSYNRVYLNDILPLIGKKDIRTAIAWCDRNDVLIFNDGKDKFVLKHDFNRALEQPVIKHFVVTYGEKWEQHYKKYLEVTKPMVSQVATNTTYTPQSSSSQQLLSEFL